MPDQTESRPPGGSNRDQSSMPRRTDRRLHRHSAQATNESTPVGSPIVANDDPTYLSGESGTAQRAPGQAEQDPQSAPGHGETSPPTSRPDASAVRDGYVSVVATVVDPPDGKYNLPFIKDADSPVAASYRVLRHRLREANDPSSIAVTSPGRREGKTTCAINLAMALAEHGREKVLLVEANFRFPSLASSLGFTAPSCFGKQMATHLKNPLSTWEVVAAFFHNLHVLAIDPESVGLWRMSAPGLKLAMEQLKASGYKHIIVDCPSALGSADVNVIEDTTDGVMLTARPHKTTAESLKKTVRHLAPANILGVVAT